MKVIDQLGGTNLEGHKTEITALSAGIVNVIMIVLSMFFGIEFAEGVWEGINTVFGLVLALTLGSRLSRTEKAANQSIASKPKEEPQT